MAKEIKNEKAQVGRRPLLIALVVLLLAAAVWGVSAKYIYQSESKGLAHAGEFYFTSDMLTAEGGKTYPLNSGTTTVSFYLRNYEGLNLSDLDINYTVTVEPADGVTVDSASGTLEAVNESEKKIVLSGLKKGTKYTVTATGQNGYSETLSATFDIKDDTGVYKNTRYFGDYLLLTVWTEGMKATDIEIPIPIGLIPDATDPMLQALAPLSVDGDYQKPSIELKLDAEESRSFRFFVESGYESNFSDTTELTVTEGGVSLDETILD